MMAMGSGLCSSVGYAAETVAGTYVAPTRHLEHVKESLKFNRQWIDSQGLKGCRRTLSRRVLGTSEVTGSVTHELGPQGIGILLKQLMGAVSTSGAGPYTHTFTAGDGVESTMTVQVGRPSINGTVNAFSYTGMQLTGATFSSKAGEIVQSDWDWYGMAEVTSQTLVAPTYPATFNPFSFSNVTLTIAGSAYESDSIEIKVDNGLRTGHFVQRATLPGSPTVSRQAGYRQWTGTIASDFMDLTAYNRFVNGTEASLVATFDAGASAKLVFTGNVLFTGETPTVDGPGVLKQSLPFQFVSTSADNTALTVTLTNADSAP